MSTSIERNGTGSVTFGGTGKAPRLILAAIAAFGFFFQAATAATFHGEGMTLTLSKETREAAVTWKSPVTGRLLIGSSRLESTEFGTIGLATTSDMQKVAAGGIGKVAAGGIGKVAAGGIGKVAAGGIGKVAAGGIGKTEQMFDNVGTLELLVSNDALVGVLTVTENGVLSEYVFELFSLKERATISLLESSHRDL